MDIKDKRFLITGGTGSFGKTMIDFLLKNEVQEVRVLSRDEKKQDDLRKEKRDARLKLFIGDVRDIQSVDYAVEGVDFVFHAAALKQVPSCDFFPLEAVKTNILGASNVLQSAKKKNVEKTVVLSTDKAVYPINAMGMSKALMEKVMVSESRNLTSQTFSGTRYGNVIASRGSVIPLFIQQVSSGRPITITDPSMTRFLMSLEEASDLVMFAFENARNGDIFVQKSPAATIETLAKAVLKVMGKQETGSIIEIGTRHGEKKHETLVSREDMAVCEDLGKFFRIPSDTRDLNYSKYIAKGNSEVKSLEEYASYNTDMLDVGDVAELLLSNKEVRECLENIK